MIRIFSASENDFTGYGLGPLPDAVECVIEEELNGAFTMKMTYPEGGFNADKLHTGRIIFTKARPSDTVGEPFRICDIENSLDGTIQVSAQHLSYDMNFIVFNGQIEQTVRGITAACNALNDYRTGNGAIRIWFDFDQPNEWIYYDIGQMRMLSEAFYGNETSLQGKFGGDVRYRYRPDLKKELVILCDRRGVDRDVDVAYGFNMIEFKRELNSEKQVSAIKAFYDRGEPGSMTRNTEIFILDPTAEITRYYLVDVTKDVQDWPFVPRADVEVLALEKVGGEDVSKLIETIQAKVVPGAAFGIDETLIEVGDTLRIQYPALGISTRIRISKTAYDRLKDRYQSVELGTIKRNIADTIADLEKK